MRATILDEKKLIFVHQHGNPHIHLFLCWCTLQRRRFIHEKEKKKTVNISFDKNVSTDGCHQRADRETFKECWMENKHAHAQMRSSNLSAVASMPERKEIRWLLADTKENQDMAKDIKEEFSLWRKRRKTFHRQDNLSSRTRWQWSLNKWEYFCTEYNCHSLDSSTWSFPNECQPKEKKLFFSRNFGVGGADVERQLSMGTVCTTSRAYTSDQFTTSAGEIPGNIFVLRTMEDAN